MKGEILHSQGHMELPPDSAKRVGFPILLLGKSHTEAFREPQPHPSLEARDKTLLTEPSHTWVAKKQSSRVAEKIK